VTIERVTDPANKIGTAIVANPFKPAGFQASGKYAAIAVTHPFGGVKEQTAGRCAPRLAEQGLVTLAYDGLLPGGERRRAAADGGPGVTLVHLPDKDIRGNTLFRCPT
jgi:fermentation-respiration switch protein FrsA (DUF1100 family)